MDSSPEHDSMQASHTKPTIKEIKEWDEYELLKWIQQKQPKLLRDDNLEKFKAAFINGSVFLKHAGDVEFFNRCNLPMGISDRLADLAREIAGGMVQEEKEQDTSTGEAQKLTLAEALSKEGLTEKAQGKLSALTGEERIRVLRHMGTEAVQDDPHSCLPSVIEHLSPDWSQKETILHNPNNPFQFPIIRKNALFVRECYHGLYNLAIKVPIDDYDSRTLLTGTPGIGKSTFLIYFIIRWLYESTRAPDSSNNPAATFQNDEQSVTSSSRMRDVLIFQPAVSGNTFYAFARPNIVRMGTYTDFWHFFLLPTTWYLVDWKPKSKPINNVAPTLFALSPNSIQDEDFKEYEKVLSLRLCMPVWTYDELEQCRHYVYPNLSGESLKYIYERVGGVPRSCLQAPTKALRRGHTEKEAHAAGLKRLEDAFARVKDPSYVLRAQEESLGFR